MKVSSAGQLAIPPDLQKESGIFPGSEVDMRLENGAIVVRPLEPDEQSRKFSQWVEELQAAKRDGERQRSAKTLEEVEGLSRGEQFVLLLADSGFGHMSTDEMMEFLRGPYDDIDPR
jgi:bifunctional DNA-binding transcriptional regulator/antitoxin component of YhaV-PrlF toxin-antitoxin module